MTAEGTVPYPVVLRAPDLDWVKFDAELSRDGSVEPVEKALYAALASYADTAERNTAEDPDDEDVPTRRRLAACIGRSVKTVDRATVRLEEIGLIEVERRRDPDNPRSNLPSTYRLLDRERWDERAGERAAKRRAEREKKRAAKEAKEKAEREAQQAHACGHPGDTDVPTPGDTSVATLGTPVSPPWGHQCRGTSSLREESSSSSEEHSSKEEDVPSARPNPPSTDPALDNVIARTGATIEEAEDVLESIEAHAERNGIEIGPIARYVAGFADRDLRRHLKAVRAQRASQARTGVTGTTGADRTCRKHHVPLDCPVCAALPAQTVRSLLDEYGPDRRPDLARRFPEPAQA